MATTQPTLGGVTLPYPAADGGYDVDLEYRGGQRVMADGSTITDLVSLFAKHAFTLHWKALSATDLATIKSAHAALKSAPGTFLSPDNVSYTVSHHPDSRRLTINGVYVAGGVLRYDVQLRLREE